MDTAAGLLRATMVTAVLGACFLLANPVVAQCAMCSLSAEAAADPGIVNRTFTAAVLVLLVPLVGVLTVIARVTWQARHWDGAVFESVANGDEAVHPRRS